MLYFGVEVSHHVFQHGVYLPLFHSLKPVHELFYAGSGGQVPEQGGDRFPGLVNSHSPPCLPGMLSTAGHSPQSMKRLLLSKLHPHTRFY